jgi:ketosteroid isomerase-like protein
MNRTGWIGVFAIGAAAFGCHGEEKKPAPPPATTSVTTAADAPKEGAFEKQTKWIRSFVESFNKHDAEAIGRGYATDAKFVDLSEEGAEPKTTATVVAEYKSLFESVPDAKMAVTRSWHVDDAVVIEFVQGGTGGNDQGQKKPYGLVGASLVWFDDAGHVVMDHTYIDELTMEVQLGWVKPPLSQLEVRPLREVPAFSGAWEQHRAKHTPEEAKLVGVREKLYSNLSAGGEKDFLDMMSDDVRLVAYDDPKDATGKKEIAETFKEWRGMFSDIKIEATHAWACEDFAIFEGTFAGKNTGPWGPLKPTNKAFKSHFLDVTRIKNGKVDHMWTYANNDELLSHLGARGRR